MNIIKLCASVIVCACMTASPASADTVLTLPGGMPFHDTLYQFVPGLMQAFDATAPNIGENFYTVPQGSTTHVVDYSRDPFTANQSIEMGRRTLDWAIKAHEGRVIITGQSMGTMVMAAQQQALLHDPLAPPPDSLLWIETDSPQRGIARWIPEGITLPFIPWTVTRNPESQYDTIVVFGEYDGWADPPDNPLNLLATANALLGAVFVHGVGAYADPGEIPEENVSVTTNSLGATTTTYRVPTPYLPLTVAWRLILPGSVVDAVDSVLRPIIDSAYERNDQEDNGATISGDDHAVDLSDHTYDNELNNGNISGNTRVRRVDDISNTTNRSDDRLLSEDIRGLDNGNLSSDSDSGDINSRSRRSSRGDDRRDDDDHLSDERTISEVTPKDTNETTMEVK